MGDVTVVIPAHNAEKTICRTIKSVLAQTDDHWRLIVVDDGSSDKTGSLVHQISDPRVSLVSQVNLGVSAARNRGVQVATSEYVAFLDADDEWEPEFLRHIRRAIADNEARDVVFTNYSYVSTSKQAYQGPEAGKAIDLIDFLAFTLKHGVTALSSSIVIKRDVLIEVGGFPDGVKYGEDLDTWARLSWSGAKFAFVPISLTRYDDKNPVSAMKSQPLVPSGYPAVVNTFKVYLRDGKIPGHLLESAHKYAAYRMFWYIARLIQANRMTEARAVSRECAQCKFPPSRRVLLNVLLYLPAPVGSLVWRCIRRGREEAVKRGVRLKLPTGVR